MGGGMKDHVLEVMRREGGPPIIPVTVGWDTQVNLLDQGISDYDRVMDGWMNYYRSDDYSSVAYFYLDQPSNELKPLQGLETRTAKLKPAK